MSVFSVGRKNCYMVCAGDLQQRYGSSSQDISSKRASPGLLIGCTIDASTGVLSFSVNGKEVANKFQVPLTLKALSKMEVGNILNSFYFFSLKIRLGISCESSAHMKYQALFSGKKLQNIKMLTAVINILSVMFL